MEAGNRGPISEIDKITEEELYELFELDIPKPSLSPKPSAEPAPALPSSADALKQMENNLFIFAAAKAGMETVDKEKIGKIIEEASKGTEYYKKQKEKLGAMKVKVAEKREQLENAKKDPDYYIECEAKARELIEEYMQEYDVTRTWIHIDMDMFFAAVEIRDNPSLADKPVAVGSYAMISTANYIARKYGVRSAMPGFIGKKLCPSLVFVGGNYKKYKEVSVQVMSILQEYDPDFESMGLDEANLDVTDHLTLRGWTTDEDKIKLAKEIQARIYEKVKLTASCGIGANRLLAKISCDMHKPNGVTLVPFDSTEIAQFMATLSVRKIPGIGKVGEQLLNGLGFVSCKDLLDKATDLYVLFDEGNFEFYIKKALGISRNEHEEDFEGIQKSISVSETFRNISLLPEFQTKIEELAEVLGKRMAKHGIVGKTVSLEIKTYKFEVKQKSKTVPYWVETRDDIAKVGKQLLGLLWPCEPTRLIGLKVSNLAEKSDIQQQELKEAKLITEFAKSKEEIGSSKKGSESKASVEEAKVVVIQSQQLSKKRERTEKTEPAKRHVRRKYRKSQGADSEDIVKLDVYFARKSLGSDRKR